MLSCQNIILSTLGRLFSVYGVVVSKYPPVFIVLCLALSGLCGVGLLFFEEETDPSKLWLPQVKMKGKNQILGKILTNVGPALGSNSIEKVKPTAYTLQTYLHIR